MARIAGVDIPDQKKGVISLTYIYGVGNATAQEIMKKADVDVNTNVADWTDEESSRVRGILGDYTIEGQLRAETQINIKRLMDIGCYRGVRHRSGLPLRGQKTKNNSRTRKGRRKTVANKKKVTK